MWFYLCWRTSLSPSTGIRAPVPFGASAQPLEVILANGRRGHVMVEPSSSLPHLAAEFCYAAKGEEGSSFLMNECIHVLSEALDQALSKSKPPPTSISPAQGHKDSGFDHLLPGGVPWEDLDKGFAERQARDLELVKEGRGVLLYLHLKKCGGMTVQDFLQGLGWGPLGHASEDMRWFFNHGEEVLRSWNEELFSSLVVADHIPFGFHSLVAPRPYIYMTMLRSPRDRLFSYYNYLRVASDWEAPCPEGMGYCKNNWWPEGLDKNSTIAAWLDRQLRGRHYLVTHVDNYQSRMLCGPVGMNTVGPANDDTLLCALHNLKSQFAVVGVTERMDESLCVMARVLGRPPPPSSPPMINFNQYRDTAPDHPVNIPSYYVRYDEVLYQYAGTLLDAMLLDYPECTSETSNVIK